MASGMVRNIYNYIIGAVSLFSGQDNGHGRLATRHLSSSMVETKHRMIRQAMDSVERPG
jgi:hypothetical protein